MNTTLLLKSAPLLLAAAIVLGSANAAQAQISYTGGFLFTAPTSPDLIVHPGDTVLFSGSFTNTTQTEQLDAVTIGLNPNSNFGGKFTFASPFFSDVAVGQTLNFTGKLKVSSTATFGKTFFFLDANGIGDVSGETYDLGSGFFTISLAPNPVPEASTTVSLGVLLALGGLGLLGARLRKRSAV